MADLYLDHVLIAVRDLGRSRHNYADVLGFTVTPEGVHPGRGTHNRLIVFGPEYLELIAVRDTQEARADRPQMLDFLRRRQGLYMFALGSRNLDVTVAEVRRRGGQISDPVDGARSGAVGTDGYTWRSAYLDPADTPGSAMFIIQHNHTIQQRYTEPTHPTVHANGVTGIVSLSLAVKDAQAAASVWSRTLGLGMNRPMLDRVNRCQVVRLSVDNCHLEFVSPTGDGALARHLEAHGESPCLLSLRVADLSHAAAYLKARGVALGDKKMSRDGPRLTLLERQTEGVNLDLVQPESS